MNKIFRGGVLVEISPSELEVIERCELRIEIVRDIRRLERAVREREDRINELTTKLMALEEPRPLTAFDNFLKLQLISGGKAS